MPILGVVASSLRAAADTGAMFPLQVVTVGPAGASSVSFTNIPSTYTHLQVRALIRMARSSVDYLTTTFNSGTAVTGRHGIYGNGTTAGTNGASGTGQDFGPYPDSSHSASIFGALILDILDYSNTNKYKTYRFFSGNDRNGAGNVDLQSTTASTTSALSSIAFSSYYGDGFAANSQFALYAVKGA